MYQMVFNAVDRADQVIADWTVSFKTGRLYMQLFFRAVDTAVHISAATLLHQQGQFY